MDRTTIINVKLTEEDLLDFYTHNARKSILMKLIIIFALLIFCAQLIRIIAIPEALDRGAWKWILAIIALFFGMYLMNKSNAKREFKHNKRLHYNHTYTISEESIHIKGGAFNTALAWEKLYNVTESKKCFFIWLSKQSAQIIPKTSMSNEDIKVFRGLIKMKKHKN